MGIGSSIVECPDDWQLDRRVAGVQALNSLFFAGGSTGRQWDAEAAVLSALVHERAPPSRHAEALVDQHWWREHLSAADGDAASAAFDLFATDPAGCQVNLYEVLTCAAVLSLRLRREAKAAVLCLVWSGRDDGRLGVSAMVSLLCSLLLVPPAPRAPRSPRDLRRKSTPGLTSPRLRVRTPTTNHHPLMVGFQNSLDRYNSRQEKAAWN
ncbi:unnamed protein product [Durusdinium trenchii]|uniref:Uncharacterized protein n=1 Tax=Durusdinium trenchii TaxID=1381693 RepID=A0ABP0QWW1_9DINO